jgi:hypothetical protein
VHVLLYNLVYRELPLVFSILGISIYLSQIISHLLTAVINPGVPSREYFISSYVKEKALSLKSNRDSGYKICKICNIIVHERKNVSHCEDCNICVEGNCIYKIYKLYFNRS